MPNRKTSRSSSRPPRSFKLDREGTHHRELDERIATTQSRNLLIATFCALTFGLAMIGLAAYAIHSGYPYLAGAFGVLGSVVWALAARVVRP
jgi:hypothetical protein